MVITRVRRSGSRADARASVGQYVQYQKQKGSAYWNGQTFWVLHFELYTVSDHRQNREIRHDCDSCVEAGSTPLPLQVDNVAPTLACAAR